MYVNKNVVLGGFYHFVLGGYFIVQKGVYEKWMNIANFLIIVFLIFLSCLQIPLEKIIYFEYFILHIQWSPTLFLSPMRQKSKLVKCVENNPIKRGHGN